MRIKLTEQERLFFDKLIEVQENGIEPLKKYGITEDEIRLIKMKAEDEDLDINLEQVLNNLEYKEVIERRKSSKKSGGMSKDDEDDTLHSTEQEEVTNYIFTNDAVLKEVERRLEEQG